MQDLRGERSSGRSSCLWMRGSAAPNALHYSSGRPSDGPELASKGERGCLVGHEYSALGGWHWALTSAAAGNVPFRPRSTRPQSRRLRGSTVGESPGAIGGRAHMPWRRISI